MKTKLVPLRCRKGPELSQGVSRSLFQAVTSQRYLPMLETMADPALSPYSGMKNLLGSRPNDSVLPFVKTPDI